jgi:hypothetical protein
MSVKLYKKWYGDSSSKEPQHPLELGTAYIELASCIHVSDPHFFVSCYVAWKDGNVCSTGMFRTQAGGHRVVQCRFSHDSTIGSVGEAQLDLKLVSRCGKAGTSATSCERRR